MPNSEMHVSIVLPDSVKPVAVDGGEGIICGEEAQLAQILDRRVTEMLRKLQEFLSDVAKENGWVGDTPQQVSWDKQETTICITLKSPYLEREEIRDDVVAFVRFCLAKLVTDKVLNGTIDFQ